MKRVYFIRPIGMVGPVKIGVSKSPDGRRKTLETWAPFPLEIVAEIEGDGVLERRFHARFRDSYVRHEWFNWTPELGQVIMSINDGTFDDSILPPPCLMYLRHTPRKPWTEAQKVRASYRRRIEKAFRETRFYFEHNSWELDYSDPATLARIDAYLADPASHGFIPEWARAA